MTTAREMVARQDKREMQTTLMHRRYEFGLPIGAVADAVGCSKGHLSMLERGREMPRIDLAFRMARFYETTIEDLFADRLDGQR